MVTIAERKTVKKECEQTRKNIWQQERHARLESPYTVIDAVLEALILNSNCQALYIQSVSNGLRDEQLMMLAKVLRRGNIWCLNAGENSEIKPSTWCDFVKEIEKTGVTVSARRSLYDAVHVAVGGCFYYC
ncbi:unnamed protein product [Ectocarpus sp. 12 AP-2014]